MQQSLPILRAEFGFRKINMKNRFFFWILIFFEIRTRGGENPIPTAYFEIQKKSLDFFEI